MSGNKQEYRKPPLSFEEQAMLLIQRGLIADQEELCGFLRRTNYYRFSTYLFPFLQPNSEYFLPETRFTDVRTLYNFDQALRTLMFDAIATLEIAILRTQFVEFFTQRYGPFGYVAADSFNMLPQQHENLLNQVQESAARSREEFVRQYRDEYSNEYLPLWMAVETLSFGITMSMILNLHYKDKKDFARRYGVTNIVLDSWLHTLNYIRNLCAHHARLWNRALAIKPLIPDERHRPEFHQPAFRNTRVYAVMTIVRYLLNVIDPECDWRAEVSELLDRYPTANPDAMGFPKGWQESPIWRK